MAIKQQQINQNNYAQKMKHCSALNSGCGTNSSKTKRVKIYSSYYEIIYVYKK